MGLDMYLDAKRFFWSDEEAPKVADLPIGYEVKYVIIEVAYWRKANAIHQWFVDNVQNGMDDCGTYYVSREQLQELVDLCKKALANPSTADGFFFGPTEYDDWYVQALHATIEQIEKALTTLPEGKWDFEYKSSW